MKKEFTLKYPENYQFLFLFDYSEQSLLTASLHRHDRPGFTWDWSGCLTPGEQIEFHLIYEDRVSMKGSFHLFHSFGTGENFLFLDAWFGEMYEEHFEGNVFELGSSQPDPPLPILPVDRTPPDPSINKELIRPAGYQDLFPYLYLRYWPSLPAADEILFIEYPGNTTSPATPNFYDNLLLLKNETSPRTKIEEEALLFINGSLPYPGCFIGKTDTLLFPFNIYPEIYEVLHRYDTPADWGSLLQLPGNHINGWEEIVPLFPTTGYQLELDRIWWNVMALNIIIGYDAFTLEQLIRILIVDHLLQAIGKPDGKDSGQWQKLIRASVVLPSLLFPLPAYDPVTSPGLPPVPPPDLPPTSPPESKKVPLYSGYIVPYAIGDLQKVQHCHTGYEPGEIALIENVFTGEIKKVKNRQTRVIEETTEAASKKESLQERHTTGEQLEKEVMKTLSQTISNELDFTNLSTSYGPPTTGTYNGKVKDTRKIDNDNGGATHFAKKILAESVQRISQLVFDRRKANTRQETEDVVIRTIDNSRGNKNIRGIYRWLNKVYKMRLVNYGRRFILEFMIEKPFWTAADGETDGFQLPLLPPDKRTPPICSYKDITTENFTQLAAYYQFTDLPLPPVSSRLVTVMLNEENFFPACNLPVPEGYLPGVVTVTYKVPQPAVLIVGVKQQQLTATAATILIKDPLDLRSGLSQDLSCEVNAVPILLDIATLYGSPPVPSSFYLSVAMNCTLSSAAFSVWQLKVYNLVRQAYERQQRQTDHRTVKGSDPFNQQTENTAIRRNILDACQSVLYQLHERINGQSTPGASPPQDLVDKPAYKKFFREAFEWQELSFSVEDQPVIDRKEDLIQALEDKERNSPMAEFMKAKRLRVLVPVRSGHPFRVLYYLSTGLVFYGRDQLTPVIENDKMIVASLKQAAEIPGKDQEIDSWQITVPTQMQWLQDDDRLPEFKI